MRLTLLFLMIFTLSGCKPIVEHWTTYIYYLENRGTEQIQLIGVKDSIGTQGVVSDTIIDTTIASQKSIMILSGYEFTRLPKMGDHGGFTSIGLERCDSVFINRGVKRVDCFVNPYIKTNAPDSLSELFRLNDRSVYVPYDTVWYSEPEKHPQEIHSTFRF